MMLTRQVVSLRFQFSPRTKAPNPVRTGVPWCLLPYVAKGRRVCRGGPVYPMRFSIQTDSGMSRYGP